MIERHGLLSVTALLDLLGVDRTPRRRLESEHRPHGTVLRDADGRAVVIRDQKPLSAAKLEACLTDMTVTEWLRLLNRKVFFWPTEKRVDELLGALAYRDRAHLVLVVDTASLVAAHRSSVTLSAINTGATLYDPPKRGSNTMRPILEFEHPPGKIAEVAVDYAVPDLAHHLCRLEIRRAGHPIKVLKEIRQPTGANPGVDGISTASVTEAIKTLELAVAERPTDTAALNRLGRAYSDAGETKAAIATFARVLKVQPGDSVARGRLKQLLSRASASRPAGE